MGSMRRRSSEEKHHNATWAQMALIGTIIALSGYIVDLIFKVLSVP
jgi:hypothetical protein